MFFYRRTVSGLAIHSYIVGNKETNTCAVIDPVRDVAEYISIAEQNGMEITSILETHVHADFVSGSQELKTRLEGKPLIYCSGMGGKEWIPSYTDRIVQDGDVIEMGDLQIKAIHTPGHTPEHLMWSLFEKGDIRMLFTGDFLFVGAVGRPDLLGEENIQELSHQLYHSVFSILEKFPDATEIRPAHGAGSFCGKALKNQPYSTLGRERKQNRSLEKKPEQQWIKDLLQDMPPAPKYFPRMKKVNVAGASIIGKIKPGNCPLSPQEFQNQIEKGPS